MIGDYLEKYSYENILNTALEKVPEDVDKRQGSIIYDALAPSCYQLANMYMQLKEVLLNSFITTSYGEYLDNRVLEQGLTRYKATQAKRKGIFINDNDEPTQIQNGSRFAAINTHNNIVYKVVEAFKDTNNIEVPGAYILECENIGTEGNGYMGDLLPITYINNIKSATLTSIITAARDEETDEELKARYLLEVNQKPFGGNVAQYDKEIRNIDGIGEVQIYPTWKGGGTVKCSIIDTEYRSVSEEVVSKVQELMDPIDSSGEGLGLAPIGHKVTITTPETITINIKANIQLLNGYTVEQLQNDINISINDYLITLSKNWGISDDLNKYALTVYISQISAAILRVLGVANVSNVTINTKNNDLVLIQTGERQQIPRFGKAEFI